MSTESTQRSVSSTSSLAGKRSKASPSYMRPTVASLGKRTDKACTLKWLNEKFALQDQYEQERKRKMMRKIQPELVARRTPGYLQPTKAAKAKMAVRKYVLEGVSVEVPQVTFSPFPDSEEDVEAFAESQLGQEYQCTDDLFVGRHTYRDAENKIVLVRDQWKEQMALQFGIDVDEARRCRALGLPYDY
jgi:hypothetical protein